MADILTNNGYINDLNSYDRLRRMGVSGDESAKKQALRQVASQFEAIFTQMWMKSARETNKELFKDNPLSNSTTDLYQSLLDEQVASNLASSGHSLQSGGLADLIVKQLAPEQKTTSGELHMPGESKSFDIKGSEGFSINSVKKTNVSNKISNNNYFGKEIALGNTRGKSSIVNDNLTLLSEINVEKSYGSETKSIETAKDFVEYMMPIAKRVAEKYGLNPLAIVAQSALETGWGKHLMKKGKDLANNFFGIKASSKTVNATNADSYEYVNGKKVLINSKFRAYDNVEQSVEDYAKLISGNARYDKVKTATSADVYFEELQKAGYATDPNYARKLKQIANNPVFDKYKTEL